MSVIARDRVIYALSKIHQNKMCRKCLLPFKRKLCVTSFNLESDKRTELDIDNSSSCSQIENSDSEGFVVDHISQENKLGVTSGSYNERPNDNYDLPIFMKMKRISHTRESNSVPPTLNSHSVEEKQPVIYFPYKVKTSPLLEESNPNSIVKTQAFERSLTANLMPPKPLNKTISNWIKYLEENNVERIKNKDGLEVDILDLKAESWRFEYGSPDPTVRPSNSTCGGCGSVIHCQDITIPGYIPSEIFKVSSKTSLRNTLCQRCKFLQEQNVALNVSVPKEYYTNLLSRIKHKVALVLLLVDLTDFPCSIWPGITDVIGRKSQIIVVGNKVDLLPPDMDGYLSNVKKALVQNLQDTGVDRGGNLLDVHLISAKTYYGVENLITKIQRHWYNKGDIYLVGCTNVGKSTLFNVLLQSDLCNIKAVDLIQRATTSVWPGTTLNLLKFPVHRMSGIRLAYRKQRLAEMNKVLKQERLLRESMSHVTQNPQYATLLGRIGVTIGDDKNISEGINIPNISDPNHRKFAGSHFCYDTPGAIYTDQILDLLTIEELTKTLPKEMIAPRTVSLKGNQTLFLAGLARIDVLQVQNLLNIFLTVFSSRHLPVYVVPTEEADTFYSKNLGFALKVPSGGAERLASFPKLKSHQFHCTGTRFDESCVDILLSSAGWVSVTARQDQTCHLLVYTPEGRGCYLRQPSLLPLAVRVRGKKCISEFE